MPHKRKRSDKDIPEDIEESENEDELDSVLSTESLFDELNSYNTASSKYQIEAQIATGNMGAIYKVYDMKLKRISVLKIILPQIKKKSGQLHRFVDEARITGQLEHPNIIPINDIGVLEDDQVFIAMKHIEGEQLRDVLKRVADGDPEYESKYSLFSLLTIFRKICDAVAFAHSRRILHRDIKPENVMVGNFGEVLLVDWGLARYENRTEDSNIPGLPNELEVSTMSHQSQHGSIKGTPAYMSPEQARGMVEKIDRRTDIFLLGSTLYTIATLTEPFVGEDVYEVVNNAEHCNFIPSELRAPDRQIPAELCNIIARCMKDNQDERYQSVEELSEDIDALMEGRAVSIEKEFAKGEYLMKEGEVGKVGYVILSGRVEVYKTFESIQVRLVELGDGDCVGEMAMISDAPRSASVVALEKTTVIVITQDLIQRGLDKLPPWMDRLVRALVERLRAATSNIHPLMSADCNYHVLNQVRLLYPLLGEVAKDSYTNSLIISINTNHLIHEIAQNLCIMSDRVLMIISKLLEIGLLRPYGSDRIIIPNFRVFCEFIGFMAKKQSIKSYIPSKRLSVFFASDAEVVMSVQDPDIANPDAEIEAIIPYPVEKVVGCKSAKDVAGKFEQFYSKVHSLPNRPPLG